jgi:hypothetical protein
MDLLKPMSEYPEIFRLRQSFDRPRVEDIAAEMDADNHQDNFTDGVEQIAARLLFKYHMA